MTDVTIDVTLNGVEEAQEKAERLVETMEKAKSLADDLALLLRNLSVEVRD